MTGVTGLIGRELGKALAGRGDTLVGLVRDVGVARRRLPLPAVCHACCHTRSASGHCGHRGDERLTVSSAKGTGFLAEVVQAWEVELRTLPEQRPQLRVPVVRTRIALAKMLPMFRLAAAGRGE